MPVDAAALTLIAITLFAATVNGALGYGFSSLTVPVAVLFYANRALNPALVLIEVALNAYVLFVNRDALSVVWRRVMPIVLGLLPGVVVGTLIVSALRGVRPDMRIAYWDIAFPLALVAGVIIFVVATVLEIRHYQQRETLNAIERMG